jgi:hypothetical protein
LYLIVEHLDLSLGRLSPRQGGRYVDTSFP